MRDPIQQYRFFSKVLVTFTVTMISSILIFFMIHSYQKNLANAQKNELENLQGIARTVALSIDGDAHERMICNFKTKNSIQSNNANLDYQTIHRLLKKTQEVNQLQTPIYTLFKNTSCGDFQDAKTTFLFGVSSSEPFYRHSYELSPTCLHEKFDKGTTIEEYRTENGSWLSAFYPIKNMKGKTVAVVQVDKSFETFIATARMTLFYESIYALMFIGVISIISIFIYRKILKSMSAVNLKLKEMVNEQTKELNASNLKMKELNEKLENIVIDRTKELEVANGNLKGSNEKLKVFARVASHDLQAPLRMIKGFAQLFRKRYKDLVDEKGNEFLDFIIINSDKMSDLISEILSTSLLESENSAELKRVDLNLTIRDVMMNLRPDIFKFSAQINFENLPSIEGYSSEFLQLFQNLISNSIKYSQPDVAPVINIKSEQKGTAYLIKVSDNGRGISETALATIMEEFNRGDSTDNEGYGIGLATCQRIIKEYHGTLSVHSKEGEGTCFEFTIQDRLSASVAYKDAVDASMGAAVN